MCGICGFVGRAEAALIESMNALQAHRGPDGAGVKTFEARGDLPPASLGHRRLSIIDLSERGGQPMSYAGGRFWITYNGEIYNFRALRSELEADGFRFRSNCDTEVLLGLYVRYGEAMLDLLNGIFAFAIWDSELGELFLARDRLGVKPLYHAEHDGVFYFASEVKALLAGLPRPSLRHDKLPEYLALLWVPDPDTLFEGIHKLPPGHCARYASGTLRIRQYWDAEYNIEQDRPEDEWPGMLRDTVQGAVRRQMVSDVPLGAFLSGGLDSGAVVATMREGTSAIATYTVGFAPDDLPYEVNPDDLRYARRLASELRVEYNERVLQPEVVDLLPQLVWHMDEPVSDPAAITTYLICAAARERITVILSGMGGDEVFAGYPRHLAMQLTRPLDALPLPVRRALRQALSPRLRLGRPGRLRTARRNLLEVLRGIDQPPLDRYLTYSSYYRDGELSPLLSAELRAELGTPNPLRRHRRHAGMAAGEHWLNQLLYVDLKTFLPCLNLTYTDKMSMAASTEVRVPLLDDEVVRLAGRIPPALKLRRTKGKYVLKRAMEGVLADEIVWRPKTGFSAPVRAWLGRDLRPLVADCLSPATIRARGLLDAAAVESLIRDYTAGRADNALRIWNLLVLELWQRAYLDPPAPSAPTVPLLTGSSAR